MSRRHLTIAVLLLLTTLAACGAGEDQGAAEATAATGASASATAGVIHAADTDVGTILVDGDGFALYAFTPDSDGESTCYDECADLWPAVAGETPIADDLDTSMFGTTTRTDGTDQLTVNGQPLYVYTADTNPGQASGHGVNDVWFAVAPDGSMINAAAESGTTTTTLSDDGYSY